jgi:peptide/nickel transport system substrate-binding protein
VANSGDGTVARIDPATRRITDTVHVKSSPTALALAQGSVWTAALASAARHRGGTLRLETRVYGLDPGAFDDPALLSLAYDGLVAYRRTGGSTFGTLVANLATDVPEPSPDGKTYVFKLRPNVRYSDGAPVRPEDFRASLEALLRLHGDEVPDYYHAIVGVPRCIKAPAKCDLSTGVETDARAGTITFHLTEPDPTFLHELAFTFAYVAPTNHPFGTKAAPPATGPYRVASFAPGRRVRLVRNPYFRVWSRDARPDGLPDEIVVRGGRKINAQVAAVQRGTADVVVLSGFFGGPLAPAAINALTTRLAGQMHTNAAPELDYMFLNVHTRPFDHVDVRRAINYAADRRAIAELAGGPNLAQPTCQILPPGFAGYTPFCPYTLQPSGTGTWNGPDLGRARRLIARSGTKGMRVTVWADEEKRPIARYFVSLLGRLGYRSSLRVYLSYRSYRETVADSRTRAQIGIEGWSADFTTPAGFVAPFRCASFFERSRSNQNLAEFCDRRIEARIDAALAARGPDANAIWRDVYRRLAVAAPGVPLVNHRTVALVSRRVGNYQYHPLWGTLLDQIWVR